MVLRGIADQTLVVGERDVGGCCSVTLVVGDDLNTIILPNTDTAKKEYECQQKVDEMGEKLAHE